MKTSYLAGLIVLSLALCVSCSSLQPDIHIRPEDCTRRQGSGRHPAGADSLAEIMIPQEGLFLTAVSYPEGYDWRRDTAYRTQTGKILLLRVHDLRELSAGSGILAVDTLLALEAGGGKAVSLDADRHQFIGGHLYTECLTESRTVYRRDGRTVLLAPEAEYLRGILPLGDHVYTLSQRMKEGGFVLRRNWKQVFLSEDGILRGSLTDPGCGRTGALFEDSGQACFFYEGEDGALRLVRDGQEQSVTLPANLKQLYDIRCFEGMICLACQIRQRLPVLYFGSRKYDLSSTFPFSSEKLDFRLLRLGDEIRLSGTLRGTSNPQLYTGLWSETRLLRLLYGRCEWLEEDVYLRREGLQLTAAGFQGTEYALDPEAGSLMMPGCAWSGKEVLYLALSRSGNCPALWVNGRSYSIPLNGFLTSVILL